VPGDYYYCFLQNFDAMGLLQIGATTVALLMTTAVDALMVAIDGGLWRFWEAQGPWISL